MIIPNIDIERVPEVVIRNGIYTGGGVVEIDSSLAHLTDITPCKCKQIVLIETLAEVGQRRIRLDDTSTRGDGGVALGLLRDTKMPFARTVRALAEAA